MPPFVFRSWEENTGENTGDAKTNRDRRPLPTVFAIVWSRHVSPQLENNGAVSIRASKPRTAVPRRSRSATRDRSARKGEPRCYSSSGSSGISCFVSPFRPDRCRANYLLTYLRPLPPPKGDGPATSAIITDGRWPRSSAAATRPRVAFRPELRQSVGFLADRDGHSRGPFHRSRPGLPAPGSR